MNSFTYEIRAKPTFISVCVYVVVSFVSLLLGFAFLLASRGSVTQIFRSLPFTGISFLSLLLSVYVPLLVTYVAVRMNSRVIMWLLCCIKTCLFSYVFFGVREAYSGAGWLIQLLVLFSNQLSMVVYHCLWLRCLVFKRPAIRLTFIVCGVALLFILFFDLFVISPFTALLFIHK